MGGEGAIHCRNIAKNLEMHMPLAVEMMNHWMKPRMGKDGLFSEWVKYGCSYRNSLCNAA